MKKLAIISTDWHIDSGNVELSKQLMAQQIQLAKEEKIKKLICLGDIFDAKKAQPEIVLLAFNFILDMVESSGMELYAIAGNHDKVNLYSWESYLEPFANHPAFHLISKNKVIETENNILYFQSYIKEGLWVEELMKFLDSLQGAPSKEHKNLYLFSHQAMNGSRNNDGSKIDSTINQQLLLPFEKCFFGHYHDSQQPLPNAYHLGAWKQKNFGENDKKGFYVLVENDKGILDVEFYESDFPKYTTLEVEAKDLDSEYISRILSQNSNPSNLRLKIIGSTEELKSIPTAKLNEVGIKIKTIDTLEQIVIESNQKIQDYENVDELVKAFKEFCEERNFNYQEGLEYLKPILC